MIMVMFCRLNDSWYPVLSFTNLWQILKQIVLFTLVRTSDMDIKIVDLCFGFSRAYQEGTVECINLFICTRAIHSNSVFSVYSIL